MILITAVCISTTVYCEVYCVPREKYKLLPPASEFVVRVDTSRWGRIASLRRVLQSHQGGKSLFLPYGRHCTFCDTSIDYRALLCLWKKTNRDVVSNRRTLEGLFYRGIKKVSEVTKTYGMDLSCYADIIHEFKSELFYRFPQKEKRRGTKKRENCACITITILSYANKYNLYCWKYFLYTLI